MKHRRGVGLLFVMGLAAALALPGSAKAAHIYGGWDSNHLLVPFFDVDLNNAAVDHRNVLVTAANLTTNTPNTFPVTGSPVSADFHVRIFNQDSEEACDICLSQTARDVLTTNIADIIAGVCSPSGIAQLLDAGTGRYRGYALIELNEPTTNCVLQTNERDDDFGMVGHLYYTQLALGQTSGIDAPGYFTSIDNDPNALSVFNLVPSERLFFRFLVSLGGDPNRATTDLIVWSATQTGTGCNLPGPVPDSNCLTGVGPGNTFIVCDENEICTSQPQPSLPREVNFFLADNIIPAAFSTGGGYFQLQNNPALSGGNTLSVLGYADNKAVGVNPALNWEVIFPAQREVSQ